MKVKETKEVNLKSAQIDKEDINNALISSTLSTGLSSHTEVNEQLKDLSSAITLVNVDNDKTFYSRKDYQFDASKKDNFTEDQHQQFIEEFSHDLDEIQLRIQRAKLDMLKYYMKGSYYKKKPEGAEYGWDKDLSQNKLYIKSYSLINREEEITTTENKELISNFNELLPEDHKISYNALIGSHDAFLIHEVVSSMNYSTTLNSLELIKKLNPLMQRILKAEKEILELKSSPLLFCLDDSSSPFEHKVNEFWSDYRKIAKQLAAFAESDSWFSPCYGESMTPQRGETQSSKPFSSDYQRFMMPEGQKLERALHKNLFRETEYREKAESFLFGGGLSALECTFRLIETNLSRSRSRNDQPLEQKIFKTKDIYFEVDSSIHEFCKTHEIEAECFETNEVDSLIKRIKQDCPIAVFLNPMSNMYEMKVSQISKILKELCQWDCNSVEKEKIYGDTMFIKQHIHIVIDNSTLGKLVKWNEFDFSKLPPFVRIVSFESLIKYAEDGLEMAPAGLLTIIGEYADSEVRSIRKRMGFMPPENTVRKLAYCMDGEALDRKMQRHSRNTRYLCEALLEEASEDSFITEVIHPSIFTHPDFSIANNEMKNAGGLFNIGLQVEFLKNYSERFSTDSNEDVIFRAKMEDRDFINNVKMIAEAFSELIILLPREANLEVNKGTNYGFNKSRIAVYSKELSNSEESNSNYQIIPYLRVAPGTENIKDMALFASIIKKANNIFSSAIENNIILDFSETLTRDKVTLSHIQ